MLSVLSVSRLAFLGDRADFSYLMGYNFAMLTCFCVYSFSFPAWFLHACVKLFKWLPLVVLFFVPFLKYGLYGGMMGFWCMPALLLLLFFKDLPYRQKFLWLTFAVVIILLSYYDQTRSNVLKYLVALFLGLTLDWKGFYRRARHVVWLGFLLPIVFCVLGVTNVFNVFQADQYLDSKSFQQGSLDDTRTFLYVEVINSALDNNYVIWGRGIGRGYESLAQERMAAESENVSALRTAERQSEVGIHNIFTWGGVVYLVLFTLMWCSVVYLGVYKSRNRYVRAVGLYLSFYYFYSWVENFQGFHAMFISTWFMVALCLSPYFRGMTDAVFKMFIKSLCFSDRNPTCNIENLRGVNSRQIVKSTQD